MSDHKGIEKISAAIHLTVQENKDVNPHNLHRYGALALYLSMITLDSVASYLHYTVNGETELFAIFRLFFVDIIAIWAFAKYALRMGRHPPTLHRRLLASFSAILWIPLLMAGWLMADAAMGKKSRYVFGYNDQGEVFKYCTYVRFDTIAAGYGPAMAERFNGRMVDFCGSPIVGSKFILSWMTVMYFVIELVGFLSG